MKYKKTQIFIILVAFAAIAALIPVKTAFAATAAALSLSDASAAMTQTSDTEWTLEKTGAVNEADSTVTWDITATEGATVGGLLVINGRMTVTNKGSEGATIGNIVVNLQSKGSQWTTRSSNIADATYDDDATTANIVASASSERLSFFTENTASGNLLFIDAGTDTVLPLAPQVIIAPGEIRVLLFTASFDNNVLGLAAGTPTRAEIIVTFGNANPGPTSASNIDINGNGVIDADEDWVRSVPKRLGLIVPAETPGSQTVTLTDTVDDITTTGTVTFSNEVISLGATSGTVTVNYNAGAEGGTITNCAHLTGDGSFPGLDIEACDTQTIDAPTCTPGEPGCQWQTGDAVTYSQAFWGGDPNNTPAAALVATNFGNVYGSFFEIGLPGSSGWSSVFTNGDDLLLFLPQTGTPAALNADLVDTSTSASGQFGGEVAALKLNVDFNDSDLMGGSAAVTFGDLHVCGVTAVGQTGINGLTARQFLALANTALGGGSTSGFTYADLATLASQLNSAFLAGGVSSFAQDHLVNGSCGWEEGDLVTYPQGAYGADPSNNVAAALLANQYGNVYGAIFEVGLPSTSGFSMVFTNASALLAYLPASTLAAAALNIDLLNPTDSSSGSFGGEVAALKLNVDFNDSDLMGGSAAVTFGDLHVCGVTAVGQTDINGLTVRQFLALANTALGGGSTSGFTYADLNTLAALLNGAFAGGTVSTFAQDHLVNGACP